MVSYSRLARLPVDIFLLITRHLHYQALWNLCRSVGHVPRILRPQLRGQLILQTLSRREWRSGVRRLLQCAAPTDLTVRNKKNETALHYSARKGLVGVLEAILARYHNRKFIDAKELHHGNTAVILAASGGNERCVNLLIAHGCDMNSRNYKGETLLYCAIRKCTAELVATVLQHGGRPEQTVRDNFTCLTVALLLEKTEIAMLLIDAGADINQYDGRGYTALSWAAIFRNVQMVEWLLAHGADPSRPDSVTIPSRGKHLTPLIWAVFSQNCELVKLLLDGGADVHKCGQLEKRPPLSWAAVKRNTIIAGMLLDRKASILDPDETGKTPLDWALFSRNKAMIQLFANSNSGRQVRTCY